MQRNWDLIRQILLQLEAQPTQEGRLAPGDVPGYDWQAVSYHIRLLGEAGLAEVQCQEGLGQPPFCVARRLTWAGHELLDQIRARSGWQRIQTYARERGIDLSLEAVRLIATTVLKQIIGGD